MSAATTSLTGVLFVHWHGKADWFESFEIMLHDEYEFDTGGSVGSSVWDWQFDLITKKQTTELLTILERKIMIKGLKFIRKGKAVDIYIGDVTHAQSEQELREHAIRLHERRLSRT